MPVLDLPVDLFLIVAVKWRFPIEHDVNHHTGTPNVHFGVVFFLVYNLGRHVEWTSKHLFELLVFREVLSEPEVSQLYLQVVSVDAID